MKKLTYKELVDAIDEHNAKAQVKRQFEDEHPLYCYIVFKSETWPDHKYSLKSRTYKFRSDNKRFIPGLCGTSIFAECLDEWEDQCIRLDYYLGSWIIDYCYIKEGDK